MNDTELPEVIRLAKLLTEAQTQSFITYLRILLEIQDSGELRESAPEEVV
jgi:hypothetical protein